MKIEGFVYRLFIVLWGFSREKEVDREQTVTKFISDLLASSVIALTDGNIEISKPPVNNVKEDVSLCSFVKGSG